MSYDIPFNRASLHGDELEYMRQAVAGGHVSGNGPFTRRCEELLERELSVPKALLTTSCTHALELAALLLDIEPGDEVVVPSFTFVSTVNAFALRGARPVFVDIREDTLNLDESKLENVLTEKTKAIVPVHYAGVGSELDVIAELARDREVALVEDNAHGLFGRYRGKQLGTFGALSVLSFHETKNFSCGEGGALLVNDPRYVSRAEILREKGTDRSRFFRGEVDKYTWRDCGSSYVPSDILAAFLLAQLEQRERIQSKRQRVWENYSERLRDWADAQRVRLPLIPKHCQQPYHLFYLILPDREKRQALIQHLRDRRILSVFHYLPLHLSEMGKRFGGQPGDLPVTEDLSERLVRLPFYTELAPTDQALVIEAICELEWA